MPSILHYLDRVRPARSFDEVELAALQLAYDRACREMAIEIGDKRRETVAGLVFHLADDIADPDELVRRVVTVFGKTG